MSHTVAVDVSCSVLFAWDGQLWVWQSEKNLCKHYDFLKKMQIASFIFYLMELFNSHLHASQPEASSLAF